VLRKARKHLAMESFLALATLSTAALADTWVSQCFGYVCYRCNLGTGFCVSCNLLTGSFQVE
jgi:hypothetical protein